MRILILLSILLTALSAQTPPQAASTTTESTEGRKLGRVEGVVFNSVTGAPLARATVMLVSRSRQMANPSPMVMAEGFGQMVPQDSPVSGATDAEGKFVIENVPEGQYQAMASRANFLVGYYTERPGPTTLLTISPGGSLKNITFKLTPYGVISGRVVDSEGEPVQNVQVAAVRYAYMNGIRSLVPVGSGQSNDLGEYRVPNLAPGKYFLVAWQANHSLPGSSREAVPMTFFPNAPDTIGASQVSIEPGGETRGMDFRLKRQPAVSISGKIIGIPEGIFVSVNVSRVDESLGMLARMMQRFAPISSGKFAVAGLTHGTYEVRADHGGSRNTDALFSALRIDVGKEDLKELELVLMPGAELIGTFRVEGADLPQGMPINISLRGMDGMMGGRPSPSGKDGSIKISTIRPGKYTPNLFLPPGYFLKSIKVDDRDLGDQPIDALPQAQIKLELVLAAGGGQVSGTVEGADGKPADGAYVSIHPVDGSSLMRPDREKSTATDKNGGFTIKGLPPGTYRVFAWDSAGSREFLYDGFRKDFESKSVTVKLTETGKETVSLKANPIPKGT